MNTATVRGDDEVEEEIIFRVYFAVQIPFNPRNVFD